MRKEENIYARDIPFELTADSDPQTRAEYLGREYAHLAVCRLLKDFAGICKAYPNPFATEEEIERFIGGLRVVSINAYRDEVTRRKDADSQEVQRDAEDFAKLFSEACRLVIQLKQRF